MCERMTAVHGSKQNLNKSSREDEVVGYATYFNLLKFAWFTT